MWQGRQQQPYLCVGQNAALQEDAVTSVLALLLLLSACDAAGCKQETLERVTSTVLVQCIVRLAFSCSCSTSDGVYPPTVGCL